MNVTRGSGLLENFLAQRRSAQARKLLRRVRAQGSILDIGCGTIPRFLLDALEERPTWQPVGLERFAPDVPSTAGIKLVLADATDSPYLPFKPRTFDAVTLLAVLEHLPSVRLDALMSDIFRILRPGGALVLTTPAGGTGSLLEVLAKIRFVSSVEIGEHEQLYGKRRLRRLLEESPFERDSIQVGSFELGMNNWLLATRAH